MYEPEWPAWFKGLRPHQEQAIAEILDCYDRGAKVVWLDAPTGSGKTVIAEAVRRALDVRGLYICSSITLQDQFLKDFDYAKVLKGRKNYQTFNNPEDWPDISADDCSKEMYEGKYVEGSCEWCPNPSMCGYEIAKADALTGNVAVLNTKYFLTETNFIGKFSKQAFAVLDECDVVENELMGHVEFGLYPATLKMLGIEAPKKGVHKGTIVGWIEQELLPAVERLRDDNRHKKDRWSKKRMKRLDRLRTDAKWIKHQVNSDNWVRDNGAGPLVLKPVNVAEFGEKMIWQHSEKWLCMSATIISAEQMAADLGLEGQFDVVKVPMTFDKDKRKVIVAPVANVTKAEMEIARPKLVTAIEKISERHAGERILVHTVSYDMTKYLAAQLYCGGRKVVKYLSAKEREGALREYIDTPGAILLASSMDRGVDLPDEDCRVVVVCKVPYPYLGDPQVSARLHTDGGQSWFNVMTVRSLVQMTGRGVRNDGDYCVSYVLDKQFVTKILRNKSLLPSWWQEALVTNFKLSDLQDK